MNIYSYFGKWVELRPDRGALHVDDELFSYAELAAQVETLACMIPPSGSPFVGLLAHRSLTAYAGVLSVLRSGKAYVPLNPKFPAPRNLDILRLSGMQVLIVGREGLPALIAMQDQVPAATTLIFPDLETHELPESLRGHGNIACKGTRNGNAAPMAECSPDDFAYMLFTSGSTGQPKGVPISHCSVSAYVDYLLERYGITPDDRFSATFDLSFDLSVHDMFLAWAGGATLCCIPEKQVLMPAHFIRKHGLTMWFSVPSLAQYMERFRLLKPGAFPSLRYSLFCGEALPLGTAMQWQAAAPNSIVENIYGPTEATIGITHYRLPQSGEVKAVNGKVCIGRIYDGQSCLLLDEEGRVVEGAGEGELCLGGSQLSPGYWNDEARTAAQFISIAAPEPDRFYRTGDIVRRDAEGDLFFLSRSDMQVKIRGYRVEPEEVSHALGRFLGTDQVVTMPWPVSDGIAEGLVCFVLKEFREKEEQILPHLASVLPDYMVPREIRFIEKFPLNANGKIDRRSLI